MPPSTELPPPRSDGKWSLYADKEDSTSPPPPQRERRRKAKSKAIQYSSSPAPPERKQSSHSAYDSTNSPATERPKAKSKARSKAEKNPSDVDAAQDGRGDPNLSGIAPPLPLGLVEPQLRAYDTGFHVITSGLEVGITTIKGIADSRLICNNPSSQTFSTWRQAKSYYEVCFNDGSVSIRPALQDQTPTQMPIQKKRRLIKFSERRLPPQPPLAPAFSTPMAKGSASQPISISSTEKTPASHSREYTPLYFPESPVVLSKTTSNRKRLHAGLQAIPHGANKTGSPSGQYPAPPIPGVSPLRQYPDGSQAPPPPDPSRSLGHIDPRYVFVESSSDEGSATDLNNNSTPAATRPCPTSSLIVLNDNSTPAATRPGPSSSLIVEVHSDAPTYRTGTSSPIIISSGSEDEREPLEWPDPLVDAHAFYEMNMLFGDPGFGPRFRG